MNNIGRNFIFQLMAKGLGPACRQAGMISLRTFPTENVHLTLKIIDCRNFQLEIPTAINYTPCCILFLFKNMFPHKPTIARNKTYIFMKVNFQSKFKIP